MGFEGIVIKAFSVSGTFHVKYEKEGVRKFCNPDHFKIIKQ